MKFDEGKWVSYKELWWKVDMDKSYGMALMAIESDVNSRKIKLERFALTYPTLFRWEIKETLPNVYCVDSRGGFIGTTRTMTTNRPAGVAGTITHARSSRVGVFFRRRNNRLRGR